MARFIELTPNRTYATKANAIKAVEKKFPDAPMENGKYDNLTYILHKTEDNRYFPVFLGERAIQAGVHFHFNVAG